jgi:hypothetical protein
MTTITKPGLEQRAARHRESALKNIEQIRAYTDLAAARLSAGQPIGPVQVQSILRNAEELLAAAAALEEIGYIAQAIT